jgi:hypothetical protein
MSNHFHLLVQLRQPCDLSPLLQLAYVHHCHRGHGFVGHRSPGRFKSPRGAARGLLAQQQREFLGGMALRSMQRESRAERAAFVTSS